MRPSPAHQRINRILHEEPYSTVSYYVYWIFLLTCVAPVMAVALFFKGIFHMIATKPSKINPKEEEIEYGVVVTGCDTGIGKELALRLTAEGFIVFCGCFNEDSMKEFDLLESAIPLRLDVTDPVTIEKASDSVKRWLEHDDEGFDKANTNKTKRRRYLHALINNAGVGRIGRIDWINLEDYSACMDVNCFGMIRMVKAFLPLFKSQVVKQQYRDAQIMNVVSLAGMLPSNGGFVSAYEVSKNAAYAFSDGLRYEMRHWGINVVTVSPSFHTTPLIPEDLQTELQTRVWDQLPLKTQEEYGKDYFVAWSQHVEKTMNRYQWHLSVLIDQMLHTVQSRKPPGELVVGMDAKLFLVPACLIPQWSRHFLMNFGAPKTLPAMMKS